MKIYIIRHAESYGNLSTSLIENSDLTDFGKEQARRLGIHFKNLEIQKMFSSDLKRSLSTAYEISSETGTKVVPSKLLREKNWGELFNKSRKKIREIIRDSRKGKYHFRPISGENLPDIINRAKKFIRIIKKEKLDNIVIVTHAGFIEAFILKLFDLPLEEVEFIQIKPASISTFIFDDQFRITYFSLGDISHLIDVDLK